MTTFKIEVRVFLVAVVAFVAAYAINMFFNAVLEDCGRGNMIKARFWYMLATTGLTIAVIFILVEYNKDCDDDSDDDSDESDTLTSKSEFNSSALRRKLLKDK